MEQKIPLRKRKKLINNENWGTSIGTPLLMHWL